MPQRTTNRHRFKGTKSLEVVSDFKGGDITSDAGALLLREADRRIGLITELAQAIADRRDQAYVTHDVKTMLTQRIIGIGCGYEDGNDHAHLRDDPMFQIAANKVPGDQPLASPPTLSRLERAVTREDLVKMSKVLVDQFVAKYKKVPKHLTLDFDWTDDRIHGRQEFAAFNKHYDSYCFLPLYVFCGNDLLVAYLRPSNQDGARHTWAILALLVKALRAAWPGVEIRWRADGGFARPQSFRWCEKNRVEYVVGLPGNKCLERLAGTVIGDSALSYLWYKTPVTHFGKFRYRAGTWNKKREVIVKVDRAGEGENGVKTRYLITNIADENPETIYTKIYSPRGDMENRIKEQQLGLFADRTSSPKFLANQFRLLLSSAAYVLIEHVRRAALAGTEFAKAQCSTFRTKLLKIGAVVVRNSRRILIHMAGHYPYQPVFLDSVNLIWPLLIV